MSNGHRNKSFTPQAAPQPVAETPAPQLSEVSDTRRQVAWYRQCPHCWERLGGVGTCQNTIPPDQEDNMVGRRYYKCDKCGAGFSREFEIATLLVEKRVVTVITR